MEILPQAYNQHNGSTLHVHCEGVQLICVSSSCSLGDAWLSVCTQLDEDLIAEQDSHIFTLEYYRMLY